MKKKVIAAILALTTFGLIGGQADAAVWPNNKLSDLQTARLSDGSHRIVFKACNGATCFWWTPINSTTMADSVRALANTAFLTGKRVNMQCGTGLSNPACACTQVSVFENNALVQRCAFNIDNMQVME